MQYIFIFIFYTSMSGTAFAYLDPGSGGFIIQAILGFLAAIFAYMAFYWSKMKSFLNKILKKDKEDSKNDTSK